MPVVEVTAGTIEYEDSGGSEPALVLLHGLIMDGTLWRKVVGKLRDVTLTLSDWGGPLLLVGGRWDDRIARLAIANCEAFDNVPPREAARALPYVAEGQLVEIDDSYTLLPEDQPDRLADHMLEFLQR